MPQKSINVRISNKLATKLQQFCTQNCINKTAFINMVLENYLEQPKDLVFALKNQQKSYNSPDPEQPESPAPANKISF